MTDTITIPEAPGLTAHLLPDEEVDSPRSYDDRLAVIACRNDGPSQHGDTDAALDLGEVIDWVMDKGYPEMGWAAARRFLIEERGAVESTMVGLALTIHSGEWLHVDVADGSNCGDIWDTVFLGWAYTTAARIGAYVGEERLTDEGLATFRASVKGEADEYAAWIRGDSYVVEVRDAEGEQVDICGGYIGYEYAVSSAKDMLPTLAPVENIKLTGVDPSAKVES